ncbi:MAG: alpha/beta hydrolase [Burkholderiales bacterium]|nr:alpha/beta hydrolase [Burkholderiales bacterium]
MIPTPDRRARVVVPLGDATRNMVVHDWGDERNPRVVVCVHGLSRNGRDFDVVAPALADDYRVLCPDIPGRGESDWYATAADYTIPNYIAAIQAMFAQLGVTRYDWIGTSMGGLIGMVMAATPGSQMRRFVINDIGPVIEKAALDRIAAYVGRVPTFPSYMALFEAVQPINASFGPLTDEQMHHMVKTAVQQRPDGQWEFKADPKIGDAFRAGLQQTAVDMWPLWSAITQPVLVLRGAQSDLLSAATVERMLAAHHAAGRVAEALSISDTGHAPMIMDEPTVAAVKGFLHAAPWVAA